MKVALCLSGIIGKVKNRGGGGSIGADINPSIGHYFWKNALFNHYDVDVFIHSWSAEHENSLKELYSPKRFIFEKQKKFYARGDDWLDDYNHPLKTEEDLLNDRRYTPTFKAFGDKTWADLRFHAERSRSTWYSRKMSIGLKKEFEEKNNFKYDIVIMGRFDLWYKNPFPLDELEKPAEGFIYASPRTNGNVIREDWDYALQDLFVLGDSTTMDTFSRLYDHITEYSIPTPMAAYEHIERFIGIKKWKHLWKFLIDYNLLRLTIPENRLVLKNE